MTFCKYGDPTCPCQDGDMCHYEGPDPSLVRSDFVRQAIIEAVAENDKAWVARYEKLHKIAVAEERERAAKNDGNN